MRVYIILVNWNGWIDTISCLESIQKLSYSDYRVIVCDNGSTDGSIREIRRWASVMGISFVELTQKSSISADLTSDSLVLIDNESNLGFSGGNNTGIRYAMRDLDCKFIWLLNNDTFSFPDSLDALVDKAAKHHGIGAVASVCYFADSSSDVQAWAGTQVNLWTGYVRNSTKPREDSWFDSLYGASMLVTRGAFEDIGLLDSGFFLGWEETDFCLRLCKNGWTIAAAPHSRVLHRVNSSTRGNSLILDRYFTTSGLRLLRLHSPAPRFAMTIFIMRRIIFRLLRGKITQCWKVWQGILDYRISRPIFPKIT